MQIGEKKRKTPLQVLLVAWGTAVGIALAQEETLIHSVPGSSHIVYRVVHPFATVHGNSREADCRISWDADSTVTAVDCSVPVRSFDSGNRLRDSHAMDAVEADRFPEAEFNSRSIVPSAGRWGNYEVTGSLTFHGQTRDIQVTATPERQGDSLVVSGSFDIRLTEFGVDRPSLFFIPVRDEARISFRMVFSGL